MTDVTYHIDDEDAPYRTKIPKPSESVTLADFKAVLPARLHQHKCFFKNKDAEFGIVKQEIIDIATRVMLGTAVRPYTIQPIDMEFVASKVSMFSFGRSLNMEISEHYRAVDVGVW